MQVEFTPGCNAATPYHWPMHPLQTPRPLRLLFAALVAAFATGCAAPPALPERTSQGAQAAMAWEAQLERWPQLDVLLLGEQHDAAAHQEWQRQTVGWLAARQRLAALVIEMAPEGAGTEGLPPDAGPAQVRQALLWDERAWPWERYAPVVMAAVAAGVPVRGGNLPPARMQEAMRDTALDAHLSPSVLERQRSAIAEGHCGLLPAQRLQPMVRIQLARDAAMARTVQAAHQPGRTVLLVAGYGHVQRSLGVPTWLPTDFQSKVAIAQSGQAQTAIKKEADYIHMTPALAAQDPCAELRERWPASTPSTR